MSEAAKPTFKIATAQGAYVVTLPADLIAEFPRMFRARISIGAGAEKASHAFDATCKTSGESLLITADRSVERLPFEISDCKTFDIDAYGMDNPDLKSEFWSTPIAEIEGKFRYAQQRRCSGCSRDSTLKSYGGDDTCWCFTQVVEA